MIILSILERCSLYIFLIISLFSPCDNQIMRKLRYKSTVENTSKEEYYSWTVRSRSWGELKGNENFNEKRNFWWKKELRSWKYKVVYFNSLVELTFINLFVCLFSRFTCKTTLAQSSDNINISHFIWKKKSEYWRPGDESNRIILVIRHFHEIDHTTTARCLPKRRGVLNYSVFSKLLSGCKEPVQLSLIQGINSLPLKMMCYYVLHSMKKNNKRERNVKFIRAVH